MNVYDFSVYYFTGLTFLSGQDPYSIALYRYPFPFTYFWALMALPGYDAMPLMFIIWGVVNVALLIYAFRKEFWQWAFFFPFIHELSSGQVEMMFWSLERLMGNNWRGAMIGAFLTMKPQTALILLPWHLVDWLRHDRKTLAKWVLCTALLWGVPLLWRPDWIYTWLNLRSGDANWIYSASVTTGLFSILRLSGQPLTPPYSTPVLALLAVLGVSAVVVYVAGQFHPSKEVGKATAMLGSPLGLLYTQMALMGTAPAWLLVPLSWITVIIALTTQNFVICMVMPLAVIGWQLYKRRRDKQAAPPILATETQAK